ncbi:OLC1v1006714C1 [Oldenlandia corymbosa var. corymbosa]|uniref:OLC1v1006714C1 n=1 Tax=Oldenlandia corymbosa var. corymbosa TaxID=529605 RepID=A0AAV1DJY7_OLDCO|nr:OLC1v1006714C1 [Oldenlandia corymbosa var. corymbosa]
MKVSLFSTVAICCFFLLSAKSSLILLPDSFIQCLSEYQFSSPNSSVLSVVYARTNTSYQSILDSAIPNYRFLSSSAPKPLAIITPLLYSHVQATVICSRENRLQIRIRSGGHDFEGLSYRSQVPFIILDLRNLRSIRVDIENETAWVESGATIGELYYAVAQESPVHGFPAGTAPVVGVGGHFSGGGNSYLNRKHGLSADNVVDAIVVDFRGRILNKESMGSDFFWAIRGGGGASFGVILSWKINLVRVPPVVTVFRLAKTFKQNAIGLVHKWQYIAPHLPDDLTIAVAIQRFGPLSTPTATFNSLFLGRTEELLKMMEESFPELELSKHDCKEMSWVESALTLSEYPDQFSIEVMKNRSYSPFDANVKLKIDLVQQPLPCVAVQQLWKWCSEVEYPRLQLHPYGGTMGRISESRIPFPHRKGVLFEIMYIESWFNDEDGKDSEKYMNQVRGLYEFMTPYVQSNPRGGYVNGIDLDLGTNGNDPWGASYSKAKASWGSMYFKSNFEKLAMVKAKVDPTNFFFYEQSIPPLLFSSPESRNCRKGNFASV